MKLYICEKPSQARDIANVLGSFKKYDNSLEGSDFIVTWCLGHLLEQAPPDEYCPNIKPWRMTILPIVPDLWKMNKKSKTTKQLNAIGKLLKSVNHVVIATDADREGDVIGREVLDYFKYKGKVERLWLSALDEASIKKALLDIRPGSSTENLYQAGLGRQRADWLIGMNLTMATSSIYGVQGEGVLSVGRVQTPTLKLVVDRDRQIENFKAKDFFIVNGVFRFGSDKFIAKWEVPEELSDDDSKCINIDYAQKVKDEIENQSGTVLNYSKLKKKKAPPLCFSLSELQKIASSKFGYGVKETLELAQSLYETHKATSYPRTDCGYLPVSQFDEAETVLNAIGNIDPSFNYLIYKCDTSIKSKIWNDKKVTAHHGIIPTVNPNVNIQSMNAKEKNIYDLIKKAYIAQFLGDYEYEQRTVEIDCQNHLFRATANTPIHQGWQIALKELDDNKVSDVESSDDLMIPNLAVDGVVTHEKTNILSKKTKPPSRFTEGTLIAAMKSIAKWIEDPILKSILKETSGIGTEATRANIIETLFNRSYVDKNKKQLISSKKGRELIDLLPNNITNPATTALWEQELESIANGESELDDFLDDQIDILEGILNQLKNNAPKDNLSNCKEVNCPECSGLMTRRKGKKGFWWGCCSYPDCKYTAFDKNGEPQPKPKEKYMPHVKKDGPLNLING